MWQETRSMVRTSQAGSVGRDPGRYRAHTGRTGGLHLRRGVRRAPTARAYFPCTRHQYRAGWMTEMASFATLNLFPPFFAPSQTDSPDSAGADADDDGDGDGDGPGEVDELAGGDEADERDVIRTLGSLKRSREDSPRDTPPASATTNAEPPGVGPPPKVRKTRGSKACQGCRKIKAKCVGSAHPPCERCTAAGQEVCNVGLVGASGAAGRRPCSPSSHRSACSLFRGGVSEIRTRPPRGSSRRASRASRPRSRPRSPRCPRPKSSRLRPASSCYPQWHLDAKNPFRSHLRTMPRSPPRLSWRTPSPRDRTTRTSSRPPLPGTRITVQNCTPSPSALSIRRCLFLTSARTAR